MWLLDIFAGGRTRRSAMELVEQALRTHPAGDGARKYLEERFAHTPSRRRRQAYRIALRMLARRKPKL